MATGEAIISFGATPSTEASVAVTGQAAILATSLVEAWIMGASTSDNNEGEHLFAGVSLKLTVGIPTASTGFTIYATSTAGMATGDFKIKWVWSS